ncbi:MAG: hypothetical protein K0S97_615 [Chloroflexota bacterium]|nr:hypothetical protein [Chloroflexota bacterium]
MPSDTSEDAADEPRDAPVESTADPLDSMPPDPIGRAGRSVRLREATLADAVELDAREADPAMRGEFNDLGQPPPKPLAEQLANGKRRVSPERGACLSSASTTDRSSVK